MSVIIAVVLVVQRRGSERVWMFGYKMYSIKGTGLMEGWRNKRALRSVWIRKFTSAVFKGRGFQGFSGLEVNNEELCECVM